MERHQALLDVLADVGPPIVPVWSATDLEEALLWFTGTASIRRRSLYGCRGSCSRDG